MEPESKDIIQERIKALPSEVRDALASDELTTKIQAIGNNHHLHIDQIGTLEDEVVLAMIGLAEVGELPDQLIEQLNISKADADALANDVNEKIFLPLQDAMKVDTPAPEAVILEEPSKSVVMPSRVAPVASTAPATPAQSAPIASAPASTDVQITAPAPMAAEINAPTRSAPVVIAPLHEADVMLTEPTVSLPPTAPVATPLTKSATPPPPNSYRADPYREPIE